MDFRTWFRDTAERALSTLVQHGIILLPLIMGATAGGEFDDAALATLVAALVTVIVNAVPAFRPKVTSWLADVGLRVLRTFVATAGALVTADARNVFDAASWKGAIAAGGVAVLVVIKSEIAGRKERTLTPASFAAA